jgi:sigma-E factor negative regulatory protein RseA
MVMEQISALIDGELQSDDAGRELSRVKQDPDLRDTWDTYHLIGDALRGGSVLSIGLDRRLAERLASEPTVVAPQRRATRRIPTAVSYALSAAASLCAVAAVAWVALSGTGEPQPGIAQAPAVANVAPVVATTATPEAVRTNDYLLAHQGVSPSTALQGVAPYVRTVTMTQQLDGR